MYEWVGGSAALTGKTPYVFWVMMDIEPHREALFNDLYDNEHLPLLLKLPGSVNAVRYRTSGRRASRAISARTRSRTRTLPMSKLVERHLGHRPLEAGGAAVHLQQALHRQRARSLALRTDREDLARRGRACVRVPVDRPYTAGGRAVDANWHVLARITTSDGVERHRATSSTRAPI